MPLMSQDIYFLDILIQGQWPRMDVLDCWRCWPVLVVYQPRFPWSYNLYTFDVLSYQHSLMNQVKPMGVGRNARSWQSDEAESIWFYRGTSDHRVYFFLSINEKRTCRGVLAWEVHSLCIISLTARWSCDSMEYVEKLDLFGGHDSRELECNIQLNHLVLSNTWPLSSLTLYYLDSLLPSLLLYPPFACL